MKKPNIGILKEKLTQLALINKEILRLTTENIAEVDLFILSESSVGNNKSNFIKEKVVNKNDSFLLEVRSLVENICPGKERSYSQIADSKKTHQTKQGSVKAVHGIATTKNQGQPKQPIATQKSQAKTETQSKNAEKHDWNSNPRNGDSVSNLSKQRFDNTQKFGKIGDLAKSTKKITVASHSNTLSNKLSTGNLAKTTSHLNPLKSLIATARPNTAKPQAKPKYAPAGKIDLMLNQNIASVLKNYKANSVVGSTAGLIKTNTKQISQTQKQQISSTATTRTGTVVNSNEVSILHPSQSANKQKTLNEVFAKIKEKNNGNAERNKIKNPSFIIKKANIDLCNSQKQQESTTNKTQKILQSLKSSAGITGNASPQFILKEQGIVPNKGFIKNQIAQIVLEKRLQNL